MPASILTEPGDREQRRSDLAACSDGRLLARIEGASGVESSAAKRRDSRKCGSHVRTNRDGHVKDLRRRALLALAFLPLLASCRSRPATLRSDPLFDGRHAPDILTESRHLENPPSRGGNRFLQGWRIWRRKGTLWFVPEPRGARLEVVNLLGLT